jgi:hypothetical protein
MATDITSLNRVAYSGLDFDSISDDLRARLQVKFAASFNDFTVSSLGILLLDMAAFGLDTISFYLDRRATDTYLATARTQNAVSLLTRQLGYKMGGAVAAAADLSIAAAQVYAFALPIPKGFQFQTAAGTIYELGQSVTIPPSSLAAVTGVPAYQGQTITENFVSDASVNQIFQLSRVPTGTQIVQGTVQVTVNSTPFTESDFITFDATNQFEVGYNDVPPTVRFGDGIAGNIPVLGASIVVTYVASLGAQGQVLSGTITAVVTPLTVNFTQISLIITNPGPSSGGSDAETIDHAKIFAPQVFKSRGVAVTQGDYQALAGAYADPLFGRVAVAEAISARSAAGDVELGNRIAAIAADLVSATGAIVAAIGPIGWAANTTYSVASQVVPNPPNGFYFQATTPGVSGAAQPTWPSAGTVVDGTVVWTFAGPTPTVNASGYAATIATALTTASGVISTLVTQLNTLNSAANGASQSAQSGLNSVSGIAQNVASAISGLTQASSLTGGAMSIVNAFPVLNQANTASTVINFGDFQNLTSQLRQLLSAITNVSAFVSNLNNSSSSASAALSSSLAAIQQIQASLSGSIGLSTAPPAAGSTAPPTTVANLQIQVNSALAAVGPATPPYTALFSSLQSVVNAAALNQSDITFQTGEISSHVDALLSADCKANLVSVPILALDASGFYAAPSLGLIDSLQKYLNGIKEVTQTVVVSDGSGFLVPAAIFVRLGVTTGVSSSVTQATATSIVSGVLRGRAFGASLYVSDLDTPLKTISGVIFVNITISNPTVPVDKSGNLIVSNNQVITLGTLTFEIDVVLN